MLPENNEVTVIRIKFTKTGKLKFISHLDLCRTTKSALIRAGFPLWYSEGFNPHPKMVFALPLSVGAESMTELMDVKLTGRINEKEAVEALKRAFAPGLVPVEVYYPDSKFSDIAFASYTMRVDGGISDVAAVREAFKKPMVVMKRTKSGEREMDIRDGIRIVRVNEAGLELVLAAGGENYLNPEYIAKALGLEDYSIVRNRLFRANLEEFR